MLCYAKRSCLCVGVYIICVIITPFLQLPTEARGDWLHDFTWCECVGSISRNNSASVFVYSTE